ncbi:MAG: M28 family peptidase [Bacteroidota bacterium]|nr:M28 family peptidase [Bacteroidota bacterium]
MKLILLVSSFLIFIKPALSQTNDQDVFFIKSIYEHALEDQKSYKWLHYLSESIGGRIAGSPQSMAAIEFTHQVLDSLGADKVWRQSCPIRYWYRGEKETVSIINHTVFGTRELRALALGCSGATDQNGITGEIIEFSTLDEARQSSGKIKNKIVYFSRPFDQKYFRTFHAYGAAVDQRVHGPNLAAKFGAKACIIRSMASGIDTFPHTGSCFFEAGTNPIPSLAISTADAEILGEALKHDKVNVYVKTSCEDRGMKESFSVIGEIKGTEFPEEIILVGGHLDSWDVGGGAHDDGAGCVQSMEVFYLLKKLNYKPKRTIRCVLFQNEENGLSGATTYAKISNANNEFHLAAIESDAGGFTPLGFSFDADTSVLTSLVKRLPDWEELLGPYNLKFQKGGSGADIGQLKNQKGLLFGLSPDTQRYFDFHHTANDRIHGVNARELALGSASMASLVYLIDRYGLK